MYKFENPERITPESCKIHWKLINHEEFGSKKLLKLKNRRGEHIIQTFCKICPPPEITSPLFNFYKFQDSSKITPESSRIHSNVMNDAEIGSRKLLKLKYRMGDQIIQTFCIRSSLFNLRKFQNCEESLLDSCRMDWNLMNDEEFRSKELLKLENRRGDQIIQTFCKIGSPQKLDPPSLICTNLKTLREVLLNHTKCIES